MFSLYSIFSHWALPTNFFFIMQFYLWSCVSILLCDLLSMKHQVIMTFDMSSTEQHDCLQCWDSGTSGGRNFFTRLLAFSSIKSPPSPFVVSPYNQKDSLEHLGEPYTSLPCLGSQFPHSYACWSCRKGLRVFAVHSIVTIVSTDTSSEQKMAYVWTTRL